MVVHSPRRIGPGEASHFSGIKAGLYRRCGESVVVADEEPPLWLLFAPHESGGKLQRIGRAHAEAFELHARKLADWFSWLDFAPRGEELPEAYARRHVSRAGQGIARPQALQYALDFDRGGPPDYWRLFAQQRPSRAACLSGNAVVHDRACVPESRHFGPRVPRKWLAELRPAGGEPWLCPRRSPRTGRRETASSVRSFDLKPRETTRRLPHLLPATE